MNDKQKQLDHAWQLRQAADEALSRGRSSSLPTQDEEIAFADLHELQVHQIELEMQNEELRRAQEELIASRTRYFKLYDLAPVAYLTLDENGIILEANLAASTLLGVARGALVKKLLTRFILKEDKGIYYLYRKLLFQTGDPQSCELRMVNMDGTAFWARLETTVTQDEGGSLVFHFIISDITDRKRAEEALRENEAKYHELYTLMRMLSDTMPDMLWVKDLNKQFIFVNRAICENLLNAADTSEPIGKTDLFFAHRERDSHPEYPQWHTFGELCTDSDETTLKEMKEMQFDEYGNVKGKFLYLDVHKAPLLNKAGVLIGVVGSARDITERKLAEVELQKLASVVRYSSELVNLSTLDGKMIFLNEAGSRMLGISSNELGQINIMQVIPDPFKGKVENELMPALINIGAWAGDLQYINLQTGQITDVHATTFVIKDPVTGTPLYLANVSIDITERKRAEDALRESEERYRSILNASPDAIAITDLESRILMVSPVALTMFGCGQEERLLGRLLTDFIVPEDRERAWSNVALMFQGVMTGPGDYRGLRVDGSAFDMEANGEFIRGADGQPTSMVFVIRDITDRKLLEAEVDRARAEFLFAVSHELKTPLLVLSATQEMLEILPEEQQVERFRDYGFVWRSNLLRLRHIIENLVDSQRMPGMGMKLEKQLLSAEAIAAEVIIELEPVALTKRVKLILEAEPLPEVALDSHAWKRLLENLLTNAIKFSPSGGEVKTRFTRLDEGFQMAVIDRGSGISPQAMPFLFKPFYRSPEALRTGIQGTGLGLYVVKMIADAHGCSVEVESEEGKGTTVAIRLSLHSGSAGI